jgi:hypothetical protein
MSEATGNYRFLSGAAMDPELILATYPGARFVARARLPVSGTENEVWGIVIHRSIPATSDSDGVREVMTDDGRVLTAAVDGDGRPTGDPAAVLAAAKYWELPPAYVTRLSGSR